MSNYDNTKKMLNTLRNLTESTFKQTPLLREQEENKDLKDEITIIDGIEVRLIASTEEDLKLDEPQKKVLGDVINNFGTQVSDLGDLRPGITIQSNQVRLDGTLPDVGLDFVIIAGVNKGTYLNTAMLKTSYELLESIEKLIKFEDVFADAVNDLISERRID
jgi:hypothetical protein